MDVKKIIVNEVKYTFFNESKNTRNGFKHNTKLFINDNFISECNINYYNRTWECYQYQTSMLRVIDNYICDYVEKYKIIFKSKNNYKNMNIKRHKEFTVILNNDKSYQDLLEVKDKIKYNNFD